MIIKEIKADLFKTIKNNPNRIAVPHICNNVNAWGSGFVVPMGKEFPESKRLYLNNPQILGETQHWIGANAERIVFNMVAQNGLIGIDNPKPIKYEALVFCMISVRQALRKLELLNGYKYQIHCPRFGSERAGGNWEFIRELINEIWADYPVYVYYL